VIEPKSSMKKRGVRSSDCADALMLTFAVPEAAFANRKAKMDVIAKEMTLTHKKVQSMRKGNYSRR
jgi:hypothetical protein